MTHYSAHFSAIIDEDAQIGDGSRIWHFSHICAGTRIGENCSLGQNVFIANKVSIGNNCKIQNNVSIYDNVSLEDGVFCGPVWCLLMFIILVYSSIVKTNNRNTVVKKEETLGANCTIICGVSIDKFAFIGSGVVNQDVKDYALMVGVPARQIGWMSEYGAKLDLPLKGNAKTQCPHEGSTYVLENGIVRKIPY